MKSIANKVKESGNNQITITDRGVTFGYNNLVSDMRTIPIIQEMGYPVIFDATHSVQLPGGCGDSSSGATQITCNAILMRQPLFIMISTYIRRILNYLYIISYQIMLFSRWNGAS